MGNDKVDCYLVELGYWINYGKQNFRRNVFTPETLAGKVIRQRNTDTGLFKTVYAYSTSVIDESYLYGDYYIDFDNKDDFEKVREDVISSINVLNAFLGIDIEDIQIFFSGNKGVHLIINKDLLGVIPHKKLNIIYKYITVFVRKRTMNKTIDTQIYDNKRLFRLPNSKHEKTGLYKVLLSYEELVNATHDEIKAIASNKRAIPRKKYKAKEDTIKMYSKMSQLAIKEYNDSLTLSIANDTDKNIRDTPKCITNLLEQGPIEGMRNQTLAALTSFYKTKGYNYEDTVNLLLEWNNGSIKENEFYKTVKSIYSSKFKYGCKTFKELSVCDYKNCPLMKGRKKNAKERYTREKVC